MKMIFKGVLVGDHGLCDGVIIGGIRYCINEIIRNYETKETIFDLQDIPEYIKRRTVGIKIVHDPKIPIGEIHLNEKKQWVKE